MPCYLSTTILGAAGIVDGEPTTRLIDGKEIAGARQGHSLSCHGPRKEGRRMEGTLEMRTSSLNGTQANVDPDALRRILTNLVENSARYSTAGQPITIEGEAVGETMAIRVMAAGPGFVEEDAKHIFERFYRGNKSRTRASGGSGLGLSIVHALVRQSDGDIQIDTGPDRGTTVAISLPCQRRPDHLGHRAAFTARPSS